MKKSILFLTALLGISGLFAQITIVQSDMLQVGTDIDYFIDTTTTSLNFGKAGSNQSWDYSALSEDFYYDNSILDPSTQLMSNLFPSATATLNNFNINIQYYENTPTEAIELGVVVPFFTDTFIQILDKVVLTYPANYGDKHKDESLTYMNAVFPLGVDPDGAGPHPFVDSTGISSMEIWEYDMDAWGTLNTPEASYDVLRQFSKLTFLDSAYMYANGSWQPMSQTLASLLSRQITQTDTTFAYAFLAKGKSLPVFNIEFDPYNNNEVLTVQWMEDSTVATSVNDFMDVKTRVFPNPASDQLTITGIEEISTLEVRDASGRLMMSRNLNTGRSVIDLMELENGLHIVTIRKRNGVATINKRLSIVR